ncbi:glycosyltransferase family 4 protein [Pedobacter westerhofensis]|nr:glycosyltransferase family 1 protein [Pedobacter westerhofensis]
MQQYGGISRYFANIQHTSDVKKDIQSVVGILCTKNYYLKDYPAPLNNALGRWLLKKESRRFQWNMKYSKYLIQKNDFDILHPSYYDPYFLKYNKKPFVITVHDMIHEQFPEYFDPNDVYVRYKRLCIENADQIIAISESTSKDLQDILNVASNRITVIHHGYQMNINNSLPPEPESPVPTEKMYLLYVGDRRGYKNFPVFLSALTPLLKKDINLKLICAGGGHFAEAEIEMISRLTLQNQVSQISATDRELTSLYQNAKAFIFPSLYEGFGLPILEAFNCNCPVIASDQPCFKEIGEDAIAYFQPNDKHSILKTVEEVINNQNLRLNLITKGRLQLAKFPMDLCMDKTLSVYNKLVS